MAIIRQRIIDWLGNVVSDTNPTPAETQVIDDLAACQWMEVARAVMVSYVVAAIQRSEIVFKTDGMRSYGRDAWLWNVSPNPNQSRAEFMSCLLMRLLKDRGDALVVPVKRRGLTHLYLADGFTPEPHPGGRDVFANICIEGSTEVVRRSLTADDVYYFRIDSDSSWMQLMRNMDALYDQLGTSVAQALIDSNGRKFVLHLEQDINGTEQQRKAIENYIKGNLRSFVRSSNVVLPMYRGMNLERMSAGPTGAVSSVNAATAQTTQIRKDMFDTAAACCRIPAAFLEGNTNNFEQLLGVVPHVCGRPHRQGRDSRGNHAEDLHAGSVVGIEGRDERDRRHDPRAPCRPVRRRRQGRQAHRQLGREPQRNPQIHGPGADSQTLGR